MKYEKFDKDGVPHIRITISAHEVVERPLVDADNVLFKDGDTVESPPPSQPTPTDDA